MVYTSKILAALSVAGAANAALVEKWYNINRMTANPDGLFDKVAVGVNGTWPPPPLDVHQGDTVRIHVTNDLGTNEGTSVHHHGMFFNKTGYYDGAPGVTQCSIPPNQTLTYEIPVDTQTGTYWWHSHNGDQYADGLRAPFIIHAANESYADSYDDEFTVVLGDWYHDPVAQLNKDVFMTITNPTGAEPVPDQALIYFAQNGSYLTDSAGEVAFNDNATLPFEVGKTYRLRVINTSSFAMFFFWLEGHDMRVIEVDGTDVEEFPVDYLTVSVAQRYSVLVTAKNVTTNNFAVHYQFDETMFDVVPDDLKLNYTATVSYGQDLPFLAVEEQQERERTPDHLMSPIAVQEQFTPTRRVELGVLFDTFDDGINRAAFNNITYVMPDTPSLFTQLSMGVDASNPDPYGPQTHAVVLEKGDVVDLMVVNYDGNAHPFHLHGHQFQITRVATNVSSEDAEANPPHTLGAPNPIRRDVVIVPGDGGAVNMAFVADNPGTWIFHCHIDWHMTAGLAMVFIEAPSEAQEQLALPQVMKDQCDYWGISPTGNAAGKMSVTDLSGAPHGPYPQVAGWHAKGIGALAGTILAALLGMGVVVWYAFGGQLDEDELNADVRREMAAKAEAKKEGGAIKRGIKALKK
ncbi:laccase [Leucosporidium creatinivorum]|uniref:Laccase n=1 Tax=Leucosporidium creatinivorum TaxID=106004 RepID=A0A1Y2ET81_9BASI|nr:laccase [Leucosporidium creatinivorum]